LEEELEGFRFFHQTGISGAERVELLLQFRFTLVVGCCSIGKKHLAAGKLETQRLDELVFLEEEVGLRDDGEGGSKGFGLNAVDWRWFLRLGGCILSVFV